MRRVAPSVIAREQLQTQWSTGHQHQAVLAAAKAVNSHLQTKLGRRDPRTQPSKHVEGPYEPRRRSSGCRRREPSHPLV